MQTIYQIGTILYWPFVNFLIGEIVFIIAVVIMIKRARQHNILKKVLSWWLLGTVVVCAVFALIPKPQYTDLPYVGMLFSFSAGLLWFLYFPILKAIYLSLKS